jgi:hypothetical protein
MWRWWRCHCTTINHQLRSPQAVLALHTALSTIILSQCVVAITDTITALVPPPPRQGPLRLQRLCPPAPLAAMFEPCFKCKGSGKFIGYTGRELGECFTCKGAGKLRTRAAQEAAAVVVQDDALRATFDKLLASGLKRVKLRMQGFEVKPAKAGGKNDGALYVKQGETYLGKVIGGKFLKMDCCTPETAGKVAALMADPMAAIKATGQEVGNCAVCGLELTDPVSIEIGIGPICLKRLA